VWSLELRDVARLVGRPQMPVWVASMGTVGGGGMVSAKPLTDPVPKFLWATDSVQLVLIVEAVLL
jgi:hypothetical protein